MPTSPHTDYGSMIGKFAHDAFPNLERQVSDTLNHYTSLETSQRILESETFRLTHARCMNDYEEMRYGLYVFYELVSMFGKSEQDKQISDFLSTLFYTVIIVFDKTEEREGVFAYLREHGFDHNAASQFYALNQIQQNDLYVACFSTSEAHDSLPMWYMYADHGGGVCLEFDGQGMIGVHKKQFPDFTEQAYAFVTYNIKEFKLGMATFLRSVIEFLREFVKHGSDLQTLNEGEFLYFVSYYVGLAALSFKNPKFEHEKEIRIFCRLPRDGALLHVKFCQTPSGAMKAYIPIPYAGLSRTLLRSVWLGPTNLKEPEVLKILFSQLAGKLIDVRKSEIPFRKV